MPTVPWPNEEGEPTYLRCFDELDPITMDDLSPPLVVIPAQCQTLRVGGKSFTVNVIRDDVLYGGTKQRALSHFMEAHKAREFVYGGPSTGFAQVALTVACRLYDRKPVIITGGGKGGALGPLSERAFQWGAQVIQRSGENCKLRELQAYSKLYEAMRNLIEPGWCYNLPIGMHDNEFVDLLRIRLSQALPKRLLDNPPRRVWLVGGSCTVHRALTDLWPKTHFLLVQVGMKIFPDQLGYNLKGQRRFYATLFKSLVHFSHDTPKDQLPPYPSVRSYDAKLWRLVQEHGEEGDFVFNVSADTRTVLTEADKKKAAEWAEGKAKPYETVPVDFKVPQTMEVSEKEFKEYVKWYEEAQSTAGVQGVRDEKAFFDKLRQQELEYIYDW